MTLRKYLEEDVKTLHVEGKVSETEGARYDHVVHPDDSESNFVVGLRGSIAALAAGHVGFVCVLRPREAQPVGAVRRSGASGGRGEEGGRRDVCVARGG